MFTRLADWTETTVLVRPEYHTSQFDARPMCWGIEIVSPTKTYIVETYDGWTTWVRNTEVSSVDAGHDFILACLAQA